MSVEGFANNYEVMQKAVRGLIEAGAIRRTTTAERDAAGVDTVRLNDPLAPAPGFIGVALASFRKRWRGELILAKRSYSLIEPEQPFGLRWFIPEAWRQRRLFLDVAIAVIFLYALGLATPIFFQLVIDKVLVHESYSTLLVLTVGIGAALLFDALFTFLRRYPLI
jgi:ATP-binding cassette subfamily B protein